MMLVLVLVELSPQLVVAVKSVTGEVSGPSLKVATCADPVVPSIPETADAATTMSGCRPTVLAVKGESSSEK
jgi:hypothetical protein